MHFCTWLLVSLPSFAFLNAHSQFKLLLHIQAWRSSFLHFHSIWSFIYSFWTFWFLHLKIDAFTSSSSFYSSVPFKLSCHLSVWTLWFLFQVWTYVLLSNFEVLRITISTLASSAHSNCDIGQVSWATMMLSIPFQDQISSFCGSLSIFDALCFHLKFARLHCLAQIFSSWLHLYFVIKEGQF